MSILKPIVIGVVVATSGVPSVGAQAPADRKEQQVWSIQGLRTGYCVQFAIEPRAAARELRKGYRLLPASQDRSVHPALQQLVQHQPEFAGWSASELCFYFSDAVQVGPRRISEKNPRNQQMVATWTLATQEEGTGARRDLVLGMFSWRGGLVRAAETAGVRLHEAEVHVVESAAGENDVYNIKLERTALIWRGRPAGDSTRAEHPIGERWSVPGTRGRFWSVDLTFRPLWSRSLVGSLTVEGKGDLAKALKSSPIRFVGPLYWGGMGEMRFSP